MDVINWPVTSEVSRELDLSGMQIRRLILAGKLSARRTKLGYLIDPASVRRYQAQRASRERKAAS